MSIDPNLDALFKVAGKDGRSMTLKVSDKQALDNEEEVIMISNDI